MTRQYAIPSPLSAAALRLRWLAGGVLLATAMAALPAAAHDQPELSGKMELSTHRSADNAFLSFRCHSDGNREIARLTAKKGGGMDVRQFSGNCSEYYAYGEASLAAGDGSAAGQAFTHTCRAPIGTKRKARAAMFVLRDGTCKISQF